MASGQQEFKGKVKVDVQEASSGFQALVTGARNTTNEFKSAADAIKDGNQKMNQLGNAVQQLTTLFGSPNNRAAGLVGSVTGAVATFSELGSLFGPLGTTIGAITGAVIGLAGAYEELTRETARVVTETRNAAQEWENATTNLDLFRRRIGEVNAAIATETEVEMGLAGPEEYAARIAALEDEIRNREEIRARLQEAIDLENARIDSGELTLRQTNDAVDSVHRLREAWTNAGNEIDAANIRLSELRSTSAAAAQETADIIMEDLLNDANPRRRRERPEFRPEVQYTTDLVRPQLSEVATYSPAQTQTRATEAEIAEAANAARAREAESRSLVAEAARDQANAIREAHTAAGEEYAAAVENYGNLRETFGASTESIIEAFSSANLAARQAGTNLMSVGEGMNAVMGEIGETAVKEVGEGMANAFASAISSVIQGGEDFDKVMLKMTQSLLSNLLQEAIVQGLKELAMGIAATASYQYDAAALHYAAFGAWTAVAVAAGGALGAVSSVANASGGSAGSQRTPTTGSTASAAQQGETGGNVTNNIYLEGSMFATYEEQARIMETIQRLGGTLRDTNRA